MTSELEFTRRALRVGAVVQKTGLSESSIWRLAHQRLFPLPIKLSAGCTAWYEHEIDEWLDAKSDSREPVCGPSLDKLEDVR
jgi:prophage regulatory protein